MATRRLLTLAVATLGIIAVAPATSSALTLGDLDTTDPGACPADTTTAWLVQSASTTADYVVPAGGGVITSWSTSFGPAGAPVELVVTSPLTNGSVTVRGTDSETFPTPIPAGDVATFTLDHPITVQAGDLIGLQYIGGSDSRCLFAGASGDTVEVGLGQPTAGSTVTPLQSLSSGLTNVEVNLVQSVDLAATAAATPTTITRGDLGELTFTLTGSPSTLGTFTDTVPAGLVPLAAFGGGGSCTIAGQSVTCPVSGEPTTVQIAVQGSSPGRYTDTGSVSSPIADPNPLNNSASTMLTVVSAPPLLTCKVPNLRGAPLGIAKGVLRLLHCRVGKVRRASSKRIPRGYVISTRPRGGNTKPVGTKVTIVVSSGAPR